MSSEGGDDEGKGRGRKVPTGFDKILKRTRRGISHESKDAKEEKASKSEDGAEEKKASSDEDQKAKEEETKEEESDGE